MTFHSRVDNICIFWWSFTQVASMARVHDVPAQYIRQSKQSERMLCCYDRRGPCRPYDLGILFQAPLGVKPDVL